MTTDRIIEILLALLSVAIGVGTFYLASRATRDQQQAQRVAVDAGAYERARQIYESAIESMEDQLARLRSDLAKVDAEVAKLRESNRTLTTRVDYLEGENHQLRVELGRA